MPEPTPLPHPLPAGMAIPARPGFGPGRVLGLIALFFFYLIGVEAVVWLGSSLVLGGPARVPRWIECTLANLVMLGVAHQGGQSLGLTWRELLAPPRTWGWQLWALVSSWAALLALELSCLPWVFRRWPELQNSLPDLAFPCFFLPSVLLAPVVEEVFFRGVLCEGLARRYGSAIGVGGSALLFALAHGCWVMIPGCLLFGLLMGMLQRRTRSILPGITVHLLNNALAFSLASP